MIDKSKKRILRKATACSALLTNTNTLLLYKPRNYYDKQDPESSFVRMRKRYDAGYVLIHKSDGAEKEQEER